jgi:radical SAM protein with 4Fe4S-binding SPASM domain
MFKTEGLRGPLSICFWLNSRCNLDCPYCYAKPFTGREMEYHRLMEIISESFQLGVFDFTLAGGEPMLFPHLVSVLEKFGSNAVNVAVLTNCVSIPSEFIDLIRIKKMREHIMIQVSLDSVDSRVNEKTRGYTQKVMANIDRLLDLGVTVQIATVLTSYNIHSAHHIINRFYPRVKRFVHHVVQKTAASLSSHDIFLTNEQLTDFWVRLQNLKQHYPPDLILPSLLTRTKSVREIDSMAAFNVRATFSPQACSAGHHKAEIDPDFNVMGCDIAKAHTVIGNVRVNTLEEVWNSSRAHELRRSVTPPCLKNSCQEQCAVLSF